MTRITFEDLLTLAKSNNDKDRKRGFEYFNNWVKAADRIPSSDRLSKTQRDVLQQIFAQKGFKVVRK
jgi:hypothetical protein